MENRNCTVEGMGMNCEFWKGKRVLLTGHTGFKGSWLTLWLQSMGAQVVGYSLDPPTNPNLYEAADIGSEITSINGDIRDLEHLKSVFTEFKPEIVFHMAAQALVRQSYHEPVETYSTNVIGTVNLLESIRCTNGVRSVVNVTSDKCYENREWLWAYREDEMLGGYDPYSSSKGCAELVTNAYRRSYFHPKKYKEHGVALASVRAGNVIGGGDWGEDRLIPDILSSISQGIPVTIRNPQSIRPWQHVLEPLSGYLLLAQKLYEEGTHYAEGWNFGPNDDAPKTVKWIVENIIESWGKDTTWISGNGGGLHEAHYLKLDCSKAKTRLGWRPRMRLKDALNSIVAWHCAFLNGEDMHEFTMQQIKDFTDSCLAD